NTSISKVLRRPIEFTLFFSGSLISMDDSHLREAIRELFSNKLGPKTLELLTDRIVELTTQERRMTTDTTRQDIAGLISGKGAQYVTIWESSGN
ncbi:MAG: hypothetical protein O3B95_01925, partial [Chloroflexi bacterium]|nr:hypothetical protein [Chloroflexota bacterium]